MYSKLVTVIVCVRNGQKSIARCIESILNNDPHELIIVDGNSTDKTVEVCKKYPVKIIFDQGIGLGNARNIGLKKVKSQYVYYVGPDNLLEEDSISKLIQYMKKKNWIGVSPLIAIHEENKSYIGNSLNIYRKAKEYEGEKEIIGTPWLYQTEILKLYSFNEKMNYSDDTELCHRLRKDNHSIGISNIKSYEIGENNFPELKLRWLNYGASDSEYFRMFKKDWHIFQQINSLLSPLKKDFIKIVFSSRILIFQKIYILPFLLYIPFVR